jgi:predicted secreted protein
MANTENSSETEMVNDDETTNPPPPPPKAKTPPPPPRDEELPDDAEALKDEVRRMRDALKKTNKENADRRRRMEELEQAETARQNATLGETDRLKKEAKDAATKAAEADRRAIAAEERLIKEQIDAAVEREAFKMGWEYPDIAPSLIDRSRVEKDEETGKITGVKEALERVVKEKPNLVQAAPRGGTPSREGPRRTNTNSGTRETPEESAVSHLRASGKYSF